MFVHESISFLGRLSLLWMEHSLGHSPARLSEFNVIKIRFLRRTRECIKNIRASITLSSVNDRFYWVCSKSRVECFVIWSHGHWVPGYWRTFRSLFSMFSLSNNRGTSLRLRRGVLLYPNIMSGRTMAPCIVVFLILRYVKVTSETAVGSSSGF